jgi:hypothetical protein
MAPQINFNPTPAPSVGQTISEGLQSGLQMGLGVNQMRQQAQQMALQRAQFDLEKQKNKEEQSFKRLGTAFEIYKSLPKTGRELLWKNTIAPLGTNFLGTQLPSELPKNIDSHMDEVGQMYALHAKDPNKFTREDLKLGILAVANKAAKEGEDDTYKNLLGEAEKIPATQAPILAIQQDAQGGIVGTQNLGVGKGVVLRPQSASMQNPGVAAYTNRFDGDFTKALNFLTKVKSNLDTAQADFVSNPDGSISTQKLTFGKLHPSASQGMLGAAARSLGAGTPEQAAFAGSVGKAIDQYRKEITGAAAGFPELQRLENRLPSTAETPENFVAKSNDTLQQGVLALQKAVERAKAKGVDTAVYEKQLAELGMGAPQADVPTQASADVKQITPEIAADFIRQAGGDKNRARELARKQGYSF